MEREREVERSDEREGAGEKERERWAPSSRRILGDCLIKCLGSQSPSHNRSVIAIA